MSSANQPGAGHSGGSEFYEHRDIANLLIKGNLSAHVAWINDRQEWAYRDVATLLWQHGTDAGTLARWDITQGIEWLSRNAPRAAANKMAKVSFTDAIERWLTTIHNPLFTHWADWDAQDRHVQTPGGVFDLDAGAMRPTETGDRNLMCTACTPEDLPTPVFDGFTLAMMHGDLVMQNYLLDCLSYGLIGEACERNYFLLLGGTSTGKSTLLDLVVMLLGDYATTVKSRVFAASQGRFEAYEEARLVGKRFCVTDEIEKDATLNEGLIKKLTGGRWSTARDIYKPTVDFRPKATIWMGVNDLPKLQHGGGPIVSRERIIQADAPPLREDSGLFDKLVAEAPGILWKLCQRAAKYLTMRDLGGSVVVPRSVMNTVHEHVASVSAVEAWVEDEIKVTRSKNDFIATKALFQAFRLWCGQHDTLPGFDTAAGFGLRLQQVLNQKMHGKYGSAIRKRVGSQTRVRGFTRLKTRP